jgi:large subunit ribosomal protein L15
MQMHEIKRNTPNKKSRRIGRGGKRGKTSGSGTKGQKSRAGRKMRPELRDIIKKLPKLRGRGKNTNISIKLKPAVVNLDAVEKVFAAGETVSPKTLADKGLVRKVSGKLPEVKILGRGALAKSLSFSGVSMSASTKLVIEKAGGKTV